MHVSVLTYFKMNECTDKISAVCQLEPAYQTCKWKVIVHTHKLTDCFTRAIELVGNNLTKKQRNFGYFEVQDGADGRVDDAELAVQLPASERADIPRGVAFQTGRRRDLVRRDDAGRVGGAWPAHVNTHLPRHVTSSSSARRRHERWRHERTQATWNRRNWNSDQSIELMLTINQSINQS